MQLNEFSRERTGTTVKGSEFAASMAAAVSHRLRDHGIADTLADTIALEVLDDIRTSYSGQLIYFASDKRAKASALHEEAYDQYLANELTAPQMAQKYGFSLAWAYHVIKTVRTRRRDTREADRESVRQRDVERWKREGGIGDGA